jgi:hypothetical protein
MLVAVTVSQRLLKKCTSPFIAGCIDPANVATHLNWDAQYNLSPTAASKLSEQHELVFWTYDKSGKTLIAEYAGITAPGRHEYTKTAPGDIAVGVTLADFFAPTFSDNPFSNHCMGIAYTIFQCIMGQNLYLHAEAGAQLKYVVLLGIVYFEFFCQIMATLHVRIDRLCLAVNERNRDRTTMDEVVQNMRYYGAINTLVRELIFWRQLREAREVHALHVAQIRDEREEARRESLRDHEAVNRVLMPLYGTPVDADVLAGLMKELANTHNIFDWIVTDVDKGWDGTDYYGIVPCDPTKSFDQIIVSDHASLVDMYISTVVRNNVIDTAPIDPDTIRLDLGLLNVRLLNKPCPFTRGAFVGQTYKNSGARWIKLSNITQEILRPYFPGRQLASFTDHCAA